MSVSHAQPKHQSMLLLVIVRISLADSSPGLTVSLRKADASCECCDYRLPPVSFTSRNAEDPALTVNRKRSTHHVATHRSAYDHDNNNNNNHSHNHNNDNKRLQRPRLRVVCLYDFELTIPFFPNIARSIHCICWSRWAQPNLTCVLSQSYLELPFFCLPTTSLTSF